jgi:molybdopterin synthase catalytic subunit
MPEKKRKNPFLDGPISPEFIAGVIGKHHSQTDGGAHAIFLGQVRADVIEGIPVEGIEYSAHTEMALDVYQEIRETIFAKYPLLCAHVHHSLGIVPAGGICLFVMTTSAHRNAATSACTELVEILKKELPVWGKELFSGDRHRWKINT